MLCATASAQSEDLGKLTFSWVLLDKQQINFCNLAYANDKGSEFIVRPFKGERCTPKILAQVARAAALNIANEVNRKLLL